MFAEAFTNFSGSIAADTNTAAFDTSNIGSALVRMTLSALGASQGCRPNLQTLMPDGTTWITLWTPTTQQLTNASFLYQIGRTNAAPTGVTEAYLGGIPKICRFVLDVVNGTNATVLLEVIPTSEGA